MTTCIVTVLHKTEDQFNPYREGQTLTTAAYLYFEVNEGTPVSHVLNRAWEVGNKQAPDDEGTHYPQDRRSLSVGDVLLLGFEPPAPTYAWAVERYGFRELDLDTTDRAIAQEAAR